MTAHSPGEGLGVRPARRRGQVIGMTVVGVNDGTGQEGGLAGRW